MHTEPHPLAGQTVRVRLAAPVWGHRQGQAFDYTVEDWHDRVFGRSWQTYSGHAASLAYAARSAVAGLPLDDEVVYGHDADNIGHLLHVRELTGDSQPEPARPTAAGHVAGTKQNRAGR